MMLVLIDNGHGKETAGKRSPDSSLVEADWTRRVAELVYVNLIRRGYHVRLLVPEDEDIPLTTRANRVNYWCKHLGSSNVCLVSIHVNAAGNGKEWKTARGWSAYTSKGQTQGDLLADCLYDAAESEFQDMKIRKDMSDGDRDWEEDFTILKKTRCPAALVENFFMDNKEDCEFLRSEEGKRRCALVICNGIESFLNR